MSEGDLTTAAAPPPGWEEYRPTTSRASANEAVAVLSASAALRLSPAATALLGNPTHLILLFDKVGKRVGLRAATGEIRHSFPLRRYGGGNFWNVAIGGFRQWAGITIQDRTEFPLGMIDNTLVFRLEEGERDGEFEEFRFKSVALSQLGPNVSISKNGNMTLNRTSWERLGQPSRVVLLFNSGLRAIGVRSAAPEERHARPVRQSGTQQTWTISAEGFLKHFGVEHSSGRSYEPEFIEQMLIVHLERPKPSRGKALARGVPST